MKNIFTHVPAANENSNVFDLSHDKKMTIKMGELVPSLLLEVVPGDSFRISCENLLRFMPLVSPVMQQVVVTTHYFFVPTRILWEEWEDFITGNEDIEPPQIPYNNDFGPSFRESLYDYFGLFDPTPTPGAQTRNISALPFAAYIKIYDEYYRDENLSPELEKELTNGSSITNVPNTTYPLKRAWNHDYFTSCLPWAQKGDPVTLPLSESQNIPIELTDPGPRAQLVDHSGSGVAAGNMEQLANLSPAVSGNEVVYDPNGTLTIDIDAEAVTINTLRRALRLQEWLERNARGGTRYTEQIKAHFGVQSSDARLQRPEYIGGYKQNMVISEVLTTAETANNEGIISNPVGQMMGHGISAGRSQTKTYYSEEHGYIIGIINVQPRTSYLNQGIHRLWQRTDKLDYYWPSFANIGEQEVFNKELYVSQQATDQDTFGYIPRYSEYKYIPSGVAGEMRDTLKFWHMAREFDSTPMLNQEFIEADPTTDIFAVTDEAQIVAHIIHSITAKRKMPLFGVPTI